MLVLAFLAVDLNCNSWLLCSSRFAMVTHKNASIIIAYISSWFHNYKGILHGLLDMLMFFVSICQFDFWKFWCNKYRCLQWWVIVNLWIEICMFWSFNEEYWFLLYIVRMDSGAFEFFHFSYSWFFVWTLQVLRRQDGAQGAMSGMVVWHPQLCKAISMVEQHTFRSCLIPLVLQWMIWYWMASCIESWSCMMGVIPCL
jgi:hypothetical protein